MFMGSLMFIGSIVVLIMLMDDKGNVDCVSFKKFIDYYVVSGIVVIVFVGMMGEFVMLNYDEYVDVVLQMFELVDGWIFVIVGIGVNVIFEVILFMQCFNDIGVVGCLMVMLYYNCLMQEGLYQYFKVIVESIDLL